MTDRVWVVTGTSSGLGLAVALYALSQGDKVVATVRSLEKFPKALRDAGAKPVVLDLGTSDKVLEQAAKDALSVYGYVDVLVNNAGSTLTGVGAVEELSIDNIRQQFQVNLFGTIAFTQPFIQHFRLRKTGHIFNISSLAGVVTYPSWAAYCASKAALNAFSAALQSELALYNVRVFTILPGYFPTNLFVSHPLYCEPGVAPPLSTVYTDPVTQGYNSISTIPHIHAARGKVGDPAKLAARLFDMVTKSGLAEPMLRNDADLRILSMIPMGSDSGEAIVNRLETAAQSIRELESLWVSTDVEPDRLHEFQQ